MRIEPPPVPDSFTVTLSGKDYIAVARIVRAAMMLGSSMPEYQEVAMLGDLNELLGKLHEAMWGKDAYTTLLSNLTHIMGHGQGN